MSQQLEENLLEAIKKDDIKAFDALMETTQCGAYRLGRFPVLSLMYLYKSRKLISAYEDMFLKTTNSVTLSEPAEISKKFSAKAGKCLRLYFNEVVSPFEMLLILDKANHLKRIYPMSNLSSAIKGRLKSIYYIKYSLNVRFEGNEIIIDKRPLSYSEKKRIATICLCLVLALTIVIGVPVTTVSLIPKPIEGEVTKLSHIDFSSQKEYTLKCDIVIPQDYVVDKFNCTLIGGGYKLIFGKGATLGELNGKLSDLTIESRGDTIFKSVSQSAVINNVTVNVNADIATTEAKAFVALSNYGVIENVTVNVSGKLSALAASSQVTEELTFGGIVLNNIYNKYDSSTQTFFDGIIRNCVVNYSQFSLVGEASANAVFGGIAGFNNGCLQGCKVTGEIIADTFDVVGICVVNNVLLSDNANQADISQTSADTGWNPIVSGIVLRNNNTLENCQNTGKISAVSDSDQTDAQDDNKLTVSAAGIAYLNNGALEKCKNSAPITAVGKGDAYVGGIAAHSYSGIYNCLSSGDITVKAQTLYVGGIIGSSEVVSNGFYVYFGRVESCISNCKIDAVAIGDKPSYVGGIAGYVREEGFNVGNSTQYFGGCVINSYFVGELATEVSYFGNIVGVCGATVYEKNSYTSTSGVEYYNFDGNYYLDNSLKAFGATVIDDDNFAQVEDKGAMSATMEYIQNSEIYKSILKIFN